jgi:hypothetical protein
MIKLQTLLDDDYIKPCIRWCARDKTAAMIKLHTLLDDDYIKPCIELQRRCRLIGAHLLTHAWIARLFPSFSGDYWPCVSRLDYRFFIEMRKVCFYPISLV